MGRKLSTQTKSSLVHSLPSDQAGDIFKVLLLLEGVGNKSVSMSELIDLNPNLSISEWHSTLQVAVQCGLIHSVNMVFEIGEHQS